jgi:hypothetical protein
VEKTRTPTALPRRKSATQRVPKLLAREAKKPKMEVKKSVALNAVLRPRMSEPRGDRVDVSRE